MSTGRPAPPKAVHRSALPGVIVFAVGLAYLASADGLNAVADGSGGQWHALFLLVGLPLVAAIGGWLFAGREPPAVARQPLE